MNKSKDSQIEAAVARGELPSESSDTANRYTPEMFQWRKISARGKDGRCKWINVKTGDIRWSETTPVEA